MKSICICAWVVGFFTRARLSLIFHKICVLFSLDIAKDCDLR